MGPVTYQVFGPQTIIVDDAEHRLTQRRERTLLGSWWPDTAKPSPQVD